MCGSYSARVEFSYCADRVGRVQGAFGVYVLWLNLVAGSLDPGAGDEFLLEDDAEREAFIAYLERRYCGEKFASMGEWWREQRFKHFVDEMREWDASHLYIKSAYYAAKHPDRGGLVRATPRPEGGYELNLGPADRTGVRLALADDAERLAFVAYVEGRYGRDQTIDAWEEAEHQRYTSR